MHLKKTLLLLSLLSTVAKPDWSGSHAGDFVRVQFELGRQQASEILTRIRPEHLSLEARNVSDWVLKNKAVLSEDIRLSSHIWNNELPPGNDTYESCASTFLKPKANIYFSFNKCRELIKTKESAGLLLIHESTHHMGIVDEQFADRVAVAIYNAWGRMGHPTAPHWLYLNENNAPHNAPASTWAGKELFTANSLHGGLDMSSYNPTNDTWTHYNTSKAIKNTNMGLSSVKGRVFIWGGYEGVYVCQNKNTGSIFDIQTQTWTPASTLQAPRGRNKHFSLPTEDGILVWGGVSCNNGVQRLVLNDGGIFNPLTNTWTPISDKNAPPKSTEGAAVWTGQKLIVWGGVQEKYEDPTFETRKHINTGGIYDPKTKTWTLLPTLNAPIARRGHSAVFADNKLIVWGGTNTDYDDYGLALRSGGIFDLVQNKWLPLTIKDAPPASLQHSAIWNGEEIVYWGGSDRSQYNTVMGFYNPYSGTWRTEKRAIGPTTRNMHSAFWTGLEMIIWGGKNNNHPTPVGSSGGMFYP